MNGYQTSFTKIPELKLVPLDADNQDQVEAIQKGIASFKTNRTLGFMAPGQREDTKKWIQKSADPGNNTTVVWGITWEDMFVGTIGLSRKDNQFAHVGGGGKVIYDRGLDGKGISTAITMARTLYAVDILNLSMIQSEVMLSNVGSWRSLWHSGYQLSGVRFGVYHLQRKHHDLEFQLYLPGHPMANNVPSHLSPEVMEILAKDLATYPGMDQSSVEKLLELNTPRPKHSERMLEMLARARKEIIFE